LSWKSLAPAKSLRYDKEEEMTEAELRTAVATIREHIARVAAGAEDNELDATPAAAVTI
jgi:hypothetical protein